MNSYSFTPRTFMFLKFLYFRVWHCHLCEKDSGRSSSWRVESNVLFVSSVLGD